jgi:phosphoglycolate phosphatase
MRKKVIIFDMDGVLIDSIPFAKKYFMENHPGVTSAMYDEIHCGNFHEEIKKYSYLKKEKTEEEKKIRQQQYSEIKSRTPMFKGVRELLEKLHNEGYILVLNTNAFERNLFPILENSKITHLFDFVAPAELSKNKTEKFKLIEEKYDAKNEDVLFITDAIGDVKEAEIADIPTVAVTWGVHDGSFFENGKYPNLIKVVGTVKELGDFIEQY